MSFATLYRVLVTHVVWDEQARPALKEAASRARVPLTCKALAGDELGRIDKRFRHETF